MAISVVFTVSDAKGDQSTFSVPIPTGTALADVAGFAQALAALIQPMCNGALRDLHFSIPVTFTPWSAAASISDIQEKARFAFRTANGFLKHLSLPCALESIFAAGSRDVDIADTDVAAFITAMTDGITVNTHDIEPCDVRGEDLTELEAASEAWGKARR